MTLDGEPFRGGDPKPTKTERKAIRHVDRKATKRAVLADRECAVCKGAAATSHHIIPRGAPHFGDDVPGNLAPLCGSGTTGCHGLVENGDRKARRKLGAWIKRHPASIEYVLGKLGATAGADYLSRRYYTKVVKR